MEFFEKVEQREKWPQQACTTMFFLIPKNVTSERPIALMQTLRAPEVAKWQLKYRVDWDATDCRNGGAQQNGIGYVDGFKYRAGEEEVVAVALVQDLAKAFERVSLPVVWTTHFSFQKKILRVLFGYVEHQRRVQFEGYVAETLKNITAILPGSKWSCLLLLAVLQDALSQVAKFYPSVKLRVFADYIKGRKKRTR